MTNVSVHEAQTNLPALLQKVSEGEEIVISEADTPIARIVSATSARRARLGRGMDVGKGWVADDFTAPLPDDLQAYFEGREA
jgi:prevent-host-death family protein